jgi:hypothetical protein
MNCQCEHVIHDKINAISEPYSVMDVGKLMDIASKSNGCKNKAEIRLCDSWVICTECEASMGYDEHHFGMFEGKYSDLIWHVKKS